jgi:hypothetical protein
MKIRSNIITGFDVRQAFAQAREDNGADVYIDEQRQFKPRRERYGVEVWAYSENGKIATGHRRVGSYPLDGELRAASWSDYGYVIAHLFNKDPHAQIGFYDNEADFVEKVRAANPRCGSRSAASKDFLNVLNNIEEYAS